MTTSTATKTARSLIARGTSNAAFTQLTGCSATRSGTTATLTKTSHGLSDGNTVMIQGFSLEEFNGVFTVGGAAANTFTYTIKQDPGADPAGTPATVDKCTLSTTLTLATALEALITGVLQNTTTGPTLGPQLWMGLATADNAYDYLWSQILTGDVTANAATPFRMTLPQSAMYAKFAVFGNTGQAIDVTVQAHELTSIASV